MREGSVHRRSLALRVADRTDLAPAEVAAVLDAVFDVIGDEMAAGHDVVFAGFGTFQGRPQRAVTKVDPNTGQPVHVPPKIKPAFRASATLKKKVNLGHH